MKRRIGRLLIIPVLTALSIVLFMGSSVFAENSLSRGYLSTDEDLQVGMAVALSDKSTDEQQYVERASTENKSKYIGIATKIDDSVITIANEGSTVFVSSTGQSKVYVSDLNGSIKNGDVLVMSPLKGILMRHTENLENDTTVATSLSEGNSENQATTQSVKLENSETKNVNIYLVDAELYTNSVFPKQEKKFFSVFGESLTGKPVSEIRVLIACIILLFVLIIEGALLYGAVSSSITAVGRNPLSKKAVYKQLVHTSFLALAILFVGLIGIYVVIWT